MTNDGRAVVSVHFNPAQVIVTGPYHDALLLDLVAVAITDVAWEQAMGLAIATGHKPWLERDRLSVNTEDAAQLLGVGRTTVYRLVKDGTLPSFKLGKRRLIRIADLTELVGTGRGDDRP